MSELANYTLRKQYGRKRGIYASNEDTAKDQDSSIIVQMCRDGAITAILNSLVKHRTEKRVVIKGISYLYTLYLYLYIYDFDSSMLYIYIYIF